MAYEVIKTIKGRRYHYSQETYREGGKVRTRNVYLGPVDGERRERGITGFVKNLVRKKDRRVDIGETEGEAAVRMAREDGERARDARANELLTAPTISLSAISEIAEAQSEKSASDTADAEGGTDSDNAGDGSEGSGN